MAWLEGRLVDGEGPVAGVVVRLAHELDSLEARPTGADGRFRFDDLPDGAYRVWAFDRSGTAHRVVRNGHVTELAMRPLELALVTVRGDSGPIANARINFGAWFVATDAAGQAMVPLRHRRVSAEGYANAYPTDEWETVLARGAMIRGSVIDSNGWRVSGAVVALRGPSGQNLRADERGNWEVRAAAGDYVVAEVPR